ncbi:MAG: hypothetical protein RSE64_08455 [Oscillospiraceae bacterium]
MSGFKDMVESDVAKVLQNVNEFAELHQIVYDGKTFTANIVLDNTAQKDRPTIVSDNAEGLFIVTTTLYAAFANLQCVPKKGQRIWVDNDEYYIVTSSCEIGQIALGLRRFDE